MVRIVMVIGWLLGALLLTFIPSAYTLSGFIRRWTRFFKGPIVSRGKVVVVTGASSGIGRQIALEYGRRGAKLVLVARREHLLREVAELCKERGAEDAKIVPADLSREEDCKKMINFTVTTFGRLDILVNNAGTTISRFFEDAESPSEFRYVMNVDFWGNIHPTLHALKHLQRTKGQIVVTSSVAAYIPYPYLTFYTAAKGAIVNFYDTLRVESLLRKEVGITLAFPGFVKTELTEKEPPGHIPRWWPMISAETAAIAIVEAASERKRYVIVPGWYITSLFYRIFAPEVLTWLPQLLILKRWKTFLQKV
ncbi:hypothetical protein KP509_11G055500 [Ceratopteris richardii]|uniref:Uncharacterized protein n=1 Tax=Ceratopteris richardii TaxID=49495 RepID=A0A8T2TVQ5_CERRI|nr:hypothetical protein KP509_11G055500 [Ceratopteris richardii]